jgi:ubiquitin carboxyl-terminal hydrolase 2/21
MNSVIQCLSNTRPLLEYLLADCYLSDINTTVSSMKGALIKGTVYSQVSPDSVVFVDAAGSTLNLFL